MSELEKRLEYARYDSMPTEELQEILRKHAHGELETEPDTQELYYIMEVLAERRKQQNPQAIRSDEEAFAEFCKYYMPKESKKRPFAARWVKAAAAVAAILVVVVMSFGISAQAFDFDIWGRIANWTKEIFQFSDVQPTEPEKENNMELKSLQDALSQYNISQDIIPTWLPEGFVFGDINVASTPRETSISAKFEKNGEELIIKVRQTIGVKPEQIEKNDNLVEEYIVGDTKYYIFSNTETLQAAWVIGEFECQIIGKVSIEEIKMMIDSI
jgi:hypothetical protein